MKEATALKANGVEKWLTFLAMIRADSIAYSQEKAAVKKELKAKILDDLSQLEGGGSQVGGGSQYEYLTQKLRDLEHTEIEGYKTRIRHFPSFLKDEPDIAFYAKVEGKSKSNAAITQLAEGKSSKIYTDNSNIIGIAERFYTRLFTPNKINEATQNRLLRNIKNFVDEEKRKELDSIINDKEARRAVFGLKEHKSPGLDGVPIEFYQWFWDDIKYPYFGFLHGLKKGAIPKGKKLVLSS